MPKYGFSQFVECTKSINKIEEGDFSIAAIPLLWQKQLRRLQAFGYFREMEF